VADELWDSQTSRGSLGHVGEGFSSEAPDITLHTRRANCGDNRQTPSSRRVKSPPLNVLAIANPNTAASITGRTGSIKSKM
jgi:hypothetical protein